MAASYHLDPEGYSLGKMKEDLVSRVLIPSREPLKVGLEEKFSILEDKGIKSLDDLLKALKNRNDLENISTETGIEIDYLVLLRREANSYFPNPVALNKFSGFPQEMIEKLAAEKVKNSRHLFERVASDPDLEMLLKTTGVKREALIELLALSDLVRAYGVGPAFARILYDTGIHSIKDFRSYTAQEVIDLYQEQTGKKADFTISDIEFSLELIQVLDLDQ